MASRKHEQAPLVHFLGDAATKRAVFESCARALAGHGVGGGRGSVVVVLAGPHGCGKTYLLQQIAAAAKIMGVRAVTHEHLQAAAATMKSGFRYCAARCAVLVDDAQLADAATARVLRQIAEPLAAPRAPAPRAPAPRAAAPTTTTAMPPLLVVMCVRDLHTIGRGHPAAWIKADFSRAVRTLRRPAPNQLLACARALWQHPRGEALAHEDAVEAARMCHDGDLSQLQLLLQMHAGRRNAAAAGTDVRRSMFAEADKVMEGEGAFSLAAVPASHLAATGALGLVHACYPLAFGEDDLQAASDVAEALSDADRLHDERLAGLGLHSRKRKNVWRGAASWDERLAVLTAERRMHAAHETLTGLDGRAFDLAVVRRTGTPDELEGFLAVALRTDDAALGHRCAVARACFGRLTLDERASIAEEVGFTAREMRSAVAQRIRQSIIS